MENNDIPPELVKIFRDELLNPDLELTPSMAPDDIPGWDSASMVGIIMALEEQLGVEFGANDLKEIHTVGDLARLISQHRA